MVFHSVLCAWCIPLTCILPYEHILSYLHNGILTVNVLQHKGKANVKSMHFVVRPPEGSATRRRFPSPETHQYLACATAFGQKVIVYYARELYHDQLLLNMGK